MYKEVDEKFSKRICSCEIKTNTTGIKTVEVFMGPSEHSAVDYSFKDGEPYNEQAANSIFFYAKYDGEVIVKHCSSIYEVLKEAKEKLSLGKEDILDWKEFCDLTFYKHKKANEWLVEMSLYVFDYTLGTHDKKPYQICNKVVINAHVDPVHLIPKTPEVEAGLKSMRSFFDGIEEKLADLFGENKTVEEKTAALKMISELGAEKVLLGK